MHPPDKRSRQAQGTNACDRIGNSAAWRLQAVFHGAVKHLTTVAFDQLHNAFFDPHQVKETVVSVRNHIDNSVADTNHLVLGHKFFSS